MSTRSIILLVLQIVILLSPEMSKSKTNAVHLHLGHKNSDLEVSNVPITNGLKIGRYKFRNVKLPPVGKASKLRQTINHLRLSEGKQRILLKL